METSDTALFADPSGNDLHLVAGAVAVDAGTATGAPAEDHDGNPRPQGAGYDIGASEYGAGAIFSDGFESGGTSEWSATAGAQR